jgi:hypothetical protein
MLFQKLYIGVNIVKDGKRKIEITADVGLKVLYNGFSNVFVTAKGRHMNRMAGLCGNYNGNAKDEFIKVDMKRTANVNEFGNSWKVGRSCSNEPPFKDPCLTAGNVAQAAKKKCQLLKQQPFAVCHNSVVQDAGFIKDCEFDVCACNNHPTSCLCEEFDAYSTACSLVGIPITWKNLPQFAECSKYPHCGSHCILILLLCHLVCHCALRLHRGYHRCISVFECLNHLVGFDFNLIKLITNSQIHSYTTGQNSIYYLPHPRTNWINLAELFMISSFCNLNVKIFLTVYYFISRNALRFRTLQ